MMEKNIDKKVHIAHINDTASAVLLAFIGTLGSIGIVANSSTSISVYKDVSIKYPFTYSNSFFAFLFFAISVYLMKRILNVFMDSSRRYRICAGIFSLLISSALHFGAQLEAFENVDFKNPWLYILILFLAIYLVPIVVALWVRSNIFPDEDTKLAIAPSISATNQSRFFRVMKFISAEKGFVYKAWLMIFLLWIPTFLAFFPGAFVYDATDEYMQVITRGFTMHHPLIHVLALGGIVHAAEYAGIGANAGIAIYTILQMIICSFVLAYGILLLKRKKVKRGYLITVILIFGLFPIFPMYAICSAKDTVFTSAFVLMILLLWEYVEDRAGFTRGKCALLIISTSSMMLFRNNGKYALLVALPIMALCLIADKIPKKDLLRLLSLLLISILIYASVNLGLKVACNASDDEHQEMLTVAIQQLARVYKYSPDTYTEDEKEVLYEILPEDYLVTYTARCSDVLKSGFDNSAYEQAPQKYRKLWWDIGKRKPYIYLNAWLCNSYGYWYPDMFINVYGGNQMYTYRYEDSSYFGFETEPPGERHSLFPLYESFYRKISLELSWQKIPVLSMLFAPGFVFYIFAFFFFMKLAMKEYKRMAVLAPILLLWCTVLLGPTVLVRYVLILWYIVVFLPAMCLRRMTT